MSEGIPENWRLLMEAAGFPSARALGRRTELHASTILDLFNGRKRSDPETVEAVRAALNLSHRQMSELLKRRVVPPVEMPAEYGLLSPRQQDAVVGIVKAMLDPGEMSVAASTNLTSIGATKRRRGQVSESESKRATAARRGAGKPDEGVADDH